MPLIDASDNLAILRGRDAERALERAERERDPRSELHHFLCGVDI